MLEQTQEMITVVEKYQLCKTNTSTTLYSIEYLDRNGIVCTHTEWLAELHVIHIYVSGMFVIVAPI